MIAEVQFPRSFACDRGRVTLHSLNSDGDARCGHGVTGVVDVRAIPQSTVCAYMQICLIGIIEQWWS